MSNGKSVWWYEHIVVHVWWCEYLMVYVCGGENT